MTENQVSDDNVLGWIRERLQPECERYERGSSVPRQLEELEITLSDVLYVLRTATSIIGRYEEDCLIVRGTTLDDLQIAIVIAPPSPKDRVRIVKVWSE